MKLTGEPFVDGGIPLSRPAEDNVSQAGRTRSREDVALARATCRRQLLAEVVAHRGYRHVMGLTTKAGFTVRSIAWLTVPPLLSVAVTVKWKGEPVAVVGVPLSKPVLDSVNQMG